MRVAAIGLAALLLAGDATAQDSWDLEVSPAGDLTVASVTYEGGVGLAVQCRDGNVEVALLGLPPALPGEINQYQMRTLATGLAPAPMEESPWMTSAGSTTALSALPLRRARGLKRGGLLVVRTIPPSGVGAPRRLEIPLPSDSSAIDRTLEACGKRTVDPRDDLLLAEDVITPAEWSRSRMFEMPPWSGRGPTRVEVSCIVAEAGRVRDCQVESESMPGLGARMLLDQPNVRLGLRENAETAIGRVIFLVVQGARIRR
ncbi:hypothetical protein [Brevundimonas sp.]|uniref:hypothetical protein n=1 Tax=Brevundimonas sp. TaxID=1871086 RepID=UPI003568BA16